SRRRGTRRAVRDAVPSGEEPAVGATAAREFRRLGEGPSAVSFDVVPAVDIKHGRCVRLRQGRADSETVYGDDPVAMAQSWQSVGAQRLDVVDLDGAFEGRPKQTAVVDRIVRALSIPVQVGGGLREIAHVAALLQAGARWAIVGTRAALDAAFLNEVCG